jgi:hypothetical protein
VAACHWHELFFEFEQATAEELLIYYFGNQMVAKGAFGLPLRIGTKNPIQNNIKMEVACTFILVDDIEHTALVRGESDTVMKEMVKAAETTISPDNSKTKVTIDLNIRGPVTNIHVFICDRKDKESGAFLKGCDDFGSDYIDYGYIQTGPVPHEDPMPAIWNRKVIPKKVYHINNRRWTYVFNFGEHDAHSNQHNGFMNFTNVEKPMLVLMVKPHSSTLDVRVDYEAYNGIWTQGFKVGKYWSFN